MLAVLLGFIGWFGSCTGNHSGNSGDTIIFNLDTTKVRVMHVGRIIIIGNRITHDRIISRELNLKPGDTISTSRLPLLLIRDRYKIYNLRLFNTVSIRVLEVSPDQFDLLVEVVERWYTFPSPIFELSDRNFNEWWQNYHHDFNRVNYGLMLDQHNLRGRNETLTMTAQFGFTRKFGLNYNIPYIDRKQKQGISFGFDYGEPKNLAYFTADHKLVYLESEVTLKKTFGANLSYHYRKSFYETHTVQVYYRRSSIRDTIALLNPNYFSHGALEQHFTGITYSFNSDHRDVILYPLKGYQYAGLITKVGLTPHDNVNQFAISLSHARHWPLKWNFFLSNFTSVYFSTPSTQPYSVYSALGYRRQIVRGYEIYVIEGPAYFLNKTTFKKRIFSRAWQWGDFPLQQFRYIPLAVYIKSYLDLGYVENYPYYEHFKPGPDQPYPAGPINTMFTNKLLAGGGGGIDIVTVYDLVLRIEYSFTRQGTHGLFINLKKEF